MGIVNLFLCCMLICGSHSMSIVEVIEPEKTVCDLVITKDGQEIERNGVATAFSGTLNQIYCDAQCTGPGASPALLWYKDRIPIKTYRRRVSSVKTTFDRTIILNIRHLLETDVGKYTCRGWINQVGWVEKSINLVYGCNAPMMLCDANRCLSPEYICDGTAQCDDMYDEMFCNECSEDQIVCDDGCLSKNMTCDGYHDCMDGADETDCGCSDDEFECASGRCVPLDNVCDKTPDCADESDEKGCPCEEFTCSDGQCMEEGSKCNITEECADGSDELDCPCISEDLTCNDGQCIEEGSRCDGIEQCADGSDELQCLTSTTTIPAAVTTEEYEYEYELPTTPVPDASTMESDQACAEIDSFMCISDNECIPPDWVCDGVGDCLDSSDEADCDCRSDQFTCDNGKCIEADGECDGIVQCRDESDELNCGTTSIPSTETTEEMKDASTMAPVPGTTTIPAIVTTEEIKDASTMAPVPAKCSADEYQCLDGTCINMTRRCDRKLDCSSGNDEQNCTCFKDQFECGDGQCIDAALLCNSIPNCKNQADEINCSVTCNESEMSCDDASSCYSEFKKCDGKFDCADKSDEKHCIKTTEKVEVENNVGEINGAESARLTLDLYED